MSHMQDGAGRHRSRAHRPTRTSSEAHRSDWDPEEGFEYASMPHRDRRRSHNQLPDEQRKPNYYPPNANSRPRRASDALPSRSSREMPPPPQSVGTRPGRPPATRRNRAHTGSSRAPSPPRPVIEESDDSSEDDEDEDSDSDDDDRLPRSRAVSRARSNLRKNLVQSRSSSASTESLSIDALTQPRTPARPRGASRARSRVTSRNPSRAASRAVSRAASRIKSSRPSSPTDSDADVDSDTPSEASSEDSKARKRGKGAAPPKQQKQKRIQAAPVTMTSELVRVQPSINKHRSKTAQGSDDSESEATEASSSSDEPKINMGRLRSRHSPAKTQVAKRMSPHREHRRHHSDPKRPSRREHHTPERKSGMRRAQPSPHSRIYNSSQGSVYHMNRSHTAPSSYVTSRSAPTRRSSSTRRSSPWLTPGHTAGRPRSRQRHEIRPCENCRTVDEFSAVGLKCGHFMCTECLKEVFRDAITNPSRTRPACPCGQQISVRRVSPMLPAKLKIRWNRNFAGQAIQQRFCCPFHNCAVWIPRWRPDQPDGTVECPQCIIHICKKCNLKTPPNVKSHKCSRDEKTRKKLDHARENPKWECSKCKIYTQQSEEGNSFLACANCGFEVCSACQHPRASKQCHCPWFESGAEEQPKVIQRPPRVPMPQEPQILQVPELVQPPRQRRLSSSGRTTRSRGSHQHHEEHRRRRKHEREEMLLTHETLYDEPELEGDDGIELYGNVAGHYMNEDYRRVHEGLAAPPSPPQHHPGMPFDRLDGDANYVSGVNRARGVNGRGSIERLAERFSERGPGGSPGHRALSIPNPTNTPRTLAPRSTMPQPPVAPPPNLRRYHTVDDDLPSPRMQQVERVPARRFTNDFVQDDLEFPSPSSRSSRSQQSRRHKEDFPYSSSVPTSDSHTNGTLAGLSGRDSGMGRVNEWRQYIDPTSGEAMTVQG